MFDENGERYGFFYGNTPYYYVRNMQGDVIRILNLFGSVLAQYEYDAWGKVIKVANANGTEQTSATFIGNVNPIRYRGYYYDAETGFYYLQSRYYDPETCRFVNADEPEMVVLTTAYVLLSKDMFAYCENNPILNSDPSGLWAEKFKGFSWASKGFNVQMDIRFLSRPYCLAYAADIIRLKGSWKWWPPGWYYKKWTHCV